MFLTLPTGERARQFSPHLCESDGGGALALPEGSGCDPRHDDVLAVGLVSETIEN